MRLSNAKNADCALNLRQFSMQAKVGRNYSLEYILSIGRLWLVMFKTSLPTLVEKYEREGGH